MKRTIMSVLCVFMVIGLFVSCDGNVNEALFGSKEVVVTIDWATYGAEFPQGGNGYFADSEGKIPLEGKSQDFTVKSGTAVSDICVYCTSGTDLAEMKFASIYDMFYSIDETLPVFVDNKDNPIDRNYQLTKNQTLYFKMGTGCVAEGCSITLADGTVKAVEDIGLGEELLTWDFYTGSLVSKKVISIDKTPSKSCREITITTDAGTEINIVDVQAFFDTDAKKYFNLSNINYKHHIGKNIMICHDGSTITTEKIVSVELHRETIEMYDLITEDSLNFFSDGALTIVPLLFSITPYEVNDNYKYDPVSMAEDRAEYGLAPYEAFSEYATKEAFEKLRLEEVQILLGKGLISQDYLTYVINKFLNSTVGIR